MRPLLFVLGLSLGVLGTVAYGMFVATPPPVSAQPVITHAPMEVSLDERFLTALLQRAVTDGAVAAPGVDVPRTEVRAELRDGTIVVNANVTVLGRTTEGTITLRPVLDGGRFRVRVDDTNLGSINLPAVDTLLETQINDRVSKLLDGMPVSVTGAAVVPGRGLVLTCQVDLDHLELRPPAVQASVAH